MQPSQTAAVPTPQNSAQDIIFECNHCATALVVDAAAAGLAVTCQGCGKPTRVPNPTAQRTADHAAKISDLQHQLKENESQRTEITSYINQHSIQLHRWQLRLKDLNDRKAKLDAELDAITGPRR
jgi:transcription elongation factor Elf1